VPEVTPVAANKGKKKNKSKKGDLKSAINNFAAAISIAPDYGLAYYNRGLAYLQQGNNALGCLDAQKACELGKCDLLESAKGNGYCR
jgi:tetratricopeptide (TPR) repeat protein